MFTDYTYHVFGKQNTAHLTLQFEMSTVSCCKEKQILESNGACCHSGLMNNHELVSYAANKVTNVC